MEDYIIKFPIHTTRSFNGSFTNGIIRLWKIHRDDIDQIQCHNSALYILFGYPTQSRKQLVYVGQTTDISRRLYEHKRLKDFWEYVIYITPFNMNDSFTQDITRYLEYRTIESFISSNAYEFLENCQFPNKPNVTQETADYCETIMSEFVLSLSLIGADIFTTTQTVVTTKRRTNISRRIISRPTQDNESTGEENDERIQIGDCGYGYALNDGRFMVEQGVSVYNSYYDGYPIALDHYGVPRFTIPYIFNSIEEAERFILAER